jgi:hypothetical protein
MARRSREGTLMLKNYVKIAYKVLLRQKFFTIVSLFGISITLAIIFVVVAMLDTVITPGGRGSKLNRALFVEEILLEGEDWNIQSSSPAAADTRGGVDPLVQSVDNGLCRRFQTRVGVEIHGCGILGHHRVRV